MFLSKLCETLIKGCLSPKLSPNTFVCSRHSLKPRWGRETMLEVLMDAPLRPLARAVCTPGFFAAALWGYKKWWEGGPRRPNAWDIIYLSFNHKTCRSTPLSRPGLFIGTQKICALLCIQIATLRYNSSVPCLYTPTCTFTAISTNPAVYLDKIKGG